MKFFLPFLTLLFHLSNCLAQNSPAKTAEIEKSEEYKFIIKSAEKYFSAGDFHNALDWYEESLHKDSNNVSVLLNTAICHLDLYADLVSIYYLKKASFNFAKFFSRLSFLDGECLPSQFAF